LDEPLGKQQLILAGGKVGLLRQHLLRQFDFFAAGQMRLQPGYGRQQIQIHGLMLPQARGKLHLPETNEDVAFLHFLSGLDQNLGDDPAFKILYALDLRGRNHLADAADRLVQGSQGRPCHAADEKQQDGHEEHAGDMPVGGRQFLEFILEVLDMHCGFGLCHRSSRAR